MDYFQYRDKSLYAEDVPLKDIAQAVRTPAYVYSQATLERHFKVFDAAFSDTDHLVCFAVKANSNIAVLNCLARLGSGADVVSGGELRRAVQAGIPAEKIVFSGVGKTSQEMADALKLGIHQFNVESEPELQNLNAVAKSLGRAAPVALRINPDVDAGTHAKISTGRAENKFGIAWNSAHRVYDLAKSLDAIDIVGIDVHIGSQLTDLHPFREAFKRVTDLVKELRADGHDIRRLDLGGGLGIPYEPDRPAPPIPQDYGQMVKDLASDLDCQIITEPGRLIAGNAGILLSRVLYVKDGENRRFAILDAAMNDLLRPAMYDAFHAIEPVLEAEDGAERGLMDFVGPVCETGDTFAQNREVPMLNAGDLVAIRSAGAYGAVMSSTYNTRALIPEVLVNGTDFAIIRPRLDVDALIAMDQLPPWLERSAGASDMVKNEV